MVMVSIPGRLQPFINNAATISIPANNINSVIQAMCRDYPALSPYLLNKNGQLSGFVNIYVNGVNIRTLDKHITLSDLDQLDIVPALSGG